MKESKVLENDEEKMNYYFWIYCIPKGKNGGHIIGMFYVGHFCVNDNKKVTFDALQIMHYMFCYSNSFNTKMKLKKGLIFSY
jgi:hypothetical protein